MMNKDNAPELTHCFPATKLSNVNNERLLPAAFLQPTVKSERRRRNNYANLNNGRMK